MASIVDICNLALSHIGDEANVQSIDPPDGTAQATHCASFYAPTRDELLGKHNWSFARKRVSLSLVSGVTSAAWEYHYQVPADMIKPIAVYPADEDYPGGIGDDADGYPFLREGDRILTNVESAVLLYVYRLNDPTKYSPLFTETFALRLGSKVAGPIIKGKEGRAVAKALKEEARVMLGDAVVADANANNYKPEHVPDWHSARGVGLVQAQRASRWRR